MSDINTLDMKVFISNAMRDIFDTMFPMDMGPSDGGLAETENGNGIVGSVSFAGDVMGSVNILVHDNPGGSLYEIGPIKISTNLEDNHGIKNSYGGRQ